MRNYLFRTKITRTRTRIRTRTRTANLFEKHSMGNIIGFMEGLEAADWCGVCLRSFPVNTTPNTFASLSLSLISKMWTKLAKRASSTIRNSLRLSYLSPRFIQPQTTTKLSPYPSQGLARVGLSRSSFPFHEGFSSPSLMVAARGHATVAEAIESTDTEDDYDEVRKRLEEMAKAEEKLDCSSYKYKMLKRRQIKMETEAWEEAAREYEELLEDMREQKLAPNLPYMKSLFLGWFEPLKNAILADQELCKDTRCRMSHAPYFNDLPADMMAVVTMHKLMALLMTNTNGVGTARVIQAACQVGEAVEHEVYESASVVNFGFYCSTWALLC